MWKKGEKISKNRQKNVVGGIHDFVTVRDTVRNNSETESLLQNNPRSDVDEIRSDSPTSIDNSDEFEQFGNLSTSEDFNLDDNFVADLLNGKNFTTKAVKEKMADYSTQHLSDLHEKISSAIADRKSEIKKYDAKKKQIENTKMFQLQRKLGRAEKYLQQNTGPRPVEVENGMLYLIREYIKYRTYADDFIADAINTQQLPENNDSSDNLQKLVRKFSSYRFMPFASEEKKTELSTKINELINSLCEDDSVKNLFGIYEDPSIDRYFDTETKDKLFKAAQEVLQQKIFDALSDSIDSSEGNSAFLLTDKTVSKYLTDGQKQVLRENLKK